MDPLTGGIDNGLGRWFIGVDFGQSRDYTAIAALQRVYISGPWDPVMHYEKRMAGLRLRHLERMPLGTPYTRVVERVRDVTHHADVLGKCHVTVDATGVGRPVVDMLREGYLDCPMCPVTITAGDAEGRGYRVPKRDLIIGLQLLLQRGALQIAAGMEYGPALVKELVQMEVRRSAQGKDQFGVWREGEHDDLVLAVALACWACKTVFPRPLVGDDGLWRRTDQEEWEALLKQTMARL